MKKKRVIIIVGAAFVLLLVVGNLLSGGSGGVEITAEEVARGEVVSRVSASGRIQPWA